MPQALSRAARRQLRYGPGGTVRFLDRDGTIGITSAAQASAYVKAERADFNDDEILVFRASDHRCLAAARSACRRRYAHGDGIASLDAIRGVPVVHAEEMLRGKWLEDPPLDYWE